MMKLLLVCISLFIGRNLFAQSPTSATIDTSNYYSFKKDGGQMDWLRQSDMVPIIIDEMIKTGFSYAFINTGMPLIINDSTFIVQQVSYSRGPEFGFVFNNMHGIPLSKSDREYLKEKTVSFTQFAGNIDGTAKFMYIKALPKNIFLIKSTCYWFQSDTKNTKYPVSKEVAINIFRQDIQAYLAKVKNNITP